MPSDPASPFDPAAIQSALHQTLDAALTAIPDGHNHAILIDASRTKGGDTQASLLYATRRHNVNGKVDWDVAAGVSYDGKDVSGGIATKISW